MQPHQSGPRRAFVSYLIRSGAIKLAALILCCSASAAEYRAFWLDAFHDGFYNQSQVDALLGVPGTTTAGQIRDANCNAVVIQVRKRADVCYPSGVGEPYMSSLSPANFNALAALIKAAHDTTGGKKRIEVHCWSVAFKTAKGAVYRQHTNTPTGSLTSFDNYWPTRLSSTTGAENADGAFDPGHPKALEYLVNAHMDLVNFQTTAGPDGTDGHIDGIHYDYVRFEANTEGYNPTSVARYNARYGVSGDPASASEQFKQWRRDQVTAFVRQMYARIQKTKPWIKQSGSFVTWNPSPTNSTRAAFQGTRPFYDVYSDWDSWIREGIVDIAVPMTYYRQHQLPADYVRWMNFEKDRKGNRHMIIGPGIYLNSLDNAILQLKMTRDASPTGNYAHGFSGYSYAVPYTNYVTGTGYGTWADFSPALVSQVTPSWDDIPSMPWKSSPINGHIMGTVTIVGTGAWADGATVSITGPVSRTQTNDGTGFYAFIDLPPGSYTVTASKTGYPNATGPVNVAVGQVTGNMYEQNFVLGGGVAPSITTQPQSQSLGQGANASFTVAATGTEPLSYQWRLYGTNIAGATASSFIRNSVQLADAGPYSVVVTNPVGSATSSNAVLTVETVIIPPGITTQPQSQAVTAGQSATFAATATGTAPLSYQWRFNATPIGGATDSTYTRANIQTADAGSYSVVVTNTAGSTNSADAILTVNCSLTATAGNGGVVSKSPDQPSYAANAVVTLTATANTGYTFTGWSGDAPGTNNPLSVTMTTNKTIAANFGSTAAEIVIDNTDPGWSNTSPGGATWTTGSSTAVPRIGANYLYTAGTGGSAITRSCRWTPDIGTAGFYDVYVYYQIGANRTAGATYQVVYDGGTAGSLQNQYSTTPNLGGWFLVGSSLPLAVGTGGYVELGNNTPDTLYVSADAAKFVLVAPITPAAISIQPQPPTQSVNVGQSATFTVTASGTPAPSYQWRFNGTSIVGATSSSYTHNNAQPADAGSYSVLVTNIAGSVVSSNAILIVNVPPGITAQPQSVTAAAGSNVTFNVTATGTAPLGYQWRLNGANLAYGTASAYTCTNVQPRDAGSYSVVVSNVAGTLASTDAVLAVTQPTPPHIDEITLLSDGQIQLQVSGNPGHYSVEATTNLSDWAELTNFNTTGTTFRYIDSETNLTPRFYRMSLLP